MHVNTAAMKRCPVHNDSYVIPQPHVHSYLLRGMWRCLYYIFLITLQSFESFCQQLQVNTDSFHLYQRLDHLPWNKALALYAMNRGLPGNLWCAFWPSKDLLFTTWPQGLRTKTSSTVQIKTSLMGLTVDMQEGGYVYCEQLPGVKVHKHTPLRIQHTISCGQPQDITGARGSCHPCLCSITHPVCVLLLPMSMSVCVLAAICRGII